MVDLSPWFRSLYDSVNYCRLGFSVGRVCQTGIETGDKEFGGMDRIHRNFGNGQCQHEFGAAATPIASALKVSVQLMGCQHAAVKPESMTIFSRRETVLKNP